MKQRKETTHICPYCNFEDTIQYFFLEDNTVRHCLDCDLTVQSIRMKIIKYLVFHLFHFTPRFLKRAVRDIGFEDITIRPAPVTLSTPHSLFRPADNVLLSIVKKTFPIFAGFINLTFRGRLVVSSSIEMLALKAPLFYNYQ
jgi:Zn ribbon nucleic-acid-binding protein